MIRISERLKDEILRRRARGMRQYAIARAAGVHPTVVSHLLNDALPIDEDDPRVIRIGAVLGLPPDQCFDGARTYVA